MNIHEEIKRFIARIQESDDRIKKFWVVVFTSAAMVLAIGLWFIQIGNTVVAFDVVGEESADLSSGGGGNSVWGTFGAGMAEIGGTIGAGWKKLGEEHSVTIESKTPNFAAKNAEEIKPVPLR